MTRREYAGAAKPTQLDADINATAASFSIRNSSGWPTGATGPFAVVINRGKADEEKALVTSRSGSTLTGVTRGYDSTSGVAHSSGATIEHVATAVDLDEANAHINDTAVDDHTQYLNTTRHDAHDHTAALASTAFVDIGGDKTHTHQAAATGGKIDHGAALTGLTDDDHTQYLLANGTRALNGPLDHDGTTVGFYGVTPVTRPTAYTQTYSTADKTLAAYTPDVENAAYTGAADSEAKLADLNALRVAYENLRAFTEDLAQQHNSLLDDLQALGLIQ